MSSSTRSWLADAKLPSEIAYVRINRFEDSNGVESTIHIQFHHGLKYDRCLELIKAITPEESKTLHRQIEWSDNFDISLTPTFHVRIFDTKI